MAAGQKDYRMLGDQPKSRLRPEDFVAQAYVVARDGQIEITPRLPFARGQKRVDFPVIAAGEPRELALFDRQSGGEVLLTTPIVGEASFVRPGEKICARIGGG